MPRHDELHVISDLHMGGNDPKFQIFDQGPLLARFIDSLTARPASRKIALCINGDTVDFLAETSPVAKYLDPQNAVEKLDRIMNDPSFKAVWEALAQFVRTKNRFLIITLGNHDLELALPWVTEHLTDKLTGGDAAAKGRLEFRFEGQGYHCEVGKSKVFCVHGNDVDIWNLTDYEALRRVGRDFPSGKAKAWTPNAGTKLVIDVMNDVKKKYPFIDLLKPEKGIGLPAVLYALDSSLSAELLHAPAIGTRYAKDRIRRMFGFLGEEEEADRPLNQRPEELESAARINRLELRELKDAQAEQWLQSSNALFNQGCQPRDLVASSDAESTLGVMSAIVSWARGRDKVEILRESLEKMGEFQGFDLKSLDDTFLNTDEAVDENVDFVITGHTHQEKAICRQEGEGYYYNSGTWVRLMRLEPDVLKSERRFRRIYTAIAKGTLLALDTTPGVIMKRPAVVTIEADGNLTRGLLRRPRLDGSNLHLSTIERSEFVRAK